MNLHIGLWNTNGLHSSSLCNSRKLFMRQELHRHVFGIVDILLVQEHKLSWRAWCASLGEEHREGKMLVGNSRTFWEPSISGFSNSWSVCSPVGSRWPRAIRDHGTLVRGRALWISLQIEDSLVGFMYAYAST